MTPDDRRDLDGVHAALTAIEGYHRGDMNTVRAAIALHKDDGTPLLLGVLAAFDSLLRSVPGEPEEILRLLRGVAMDAELGGA